MVKAVLRKGVICPVDPLPAEWTDGQELLVAEVNGICDDAEGAEPIDEWYRELDALCAQGSSEDDQRLHTALAEAHEQAKDMVRKQMRLE